MLSSTTLYLHSGGLDSSYDFNPKHSKKDPLPESVHFEIHFIVIKTRGAHHSFTFDIIMA
jgi:hypothetical protein